ncbi:MAG: hypothetical protein SW833_06870 [Cyanobacteriota bacterium]|nr:hypothetical protein [Cyanobacteriota bacterium]
MLKFKSVKFKQIFLSCWVAGIVVLGVAIALPETSLAASLPPLMANIADRAPEPNLERGSREAEKASEKVYEGLDRTQKVIGKTQKRNEAIEYARQHASDRLDSLADKARTAKGASDSLSPVDKVNLDLMQE